MFFIEILNLTITFPADSTLVTSLPSPFANTLMVFYLKYEAASPLYFNIAPTRPEK